MNEIYFYDVFDSSFPSTFMKPDILRVRQLPNGEWVSQMFDYEGMMKTYSTSGFKTKKKLLDAFARHKPSCMLNIKEVGR